MTTDPVMTAPRTTTDPVTEELLALEGAALARWCRGDPSGFLELCDPDVTYFDPFNEPRLDDLAELTRYYEALRGQVSTPSFELRSPRVQAHQDMAVLTFNFASWSADDVEHRWHCTEVYRRRASSWRIIQTHWSLMKR